MDQPLQIAGGLFLVLPLIGCIYLVLAGLQTRAFFRGGGIEPPARPVAVTVLKPLYGDEPGLEAALATFLAQDYPGEVQIILGLREAADPARAVAERLCAAHPDRDICLVVDPRSHGANGKVSNLINMAARARHPVLVLSDSDISVPSDYLTQVVQAVGGRSVGAVTCPYYGAPKAPRFWSLLAAMGQTYQFLPSVVLGSSIGLARPCMGSTIALRRDVLQEIGGFEAFADRLADDYAIGAAVRAAGYRTVVAPVLVAHGCAEASLRELLAHEQRWARTIRGVDPAGFLGSGITHAFVLALFGFILLRGAPAALAVLVIATICRLWMLRQVAKVTAVANEPWWLFPVRDILSFVVFVSSFFVSVVDWRGARYRVDQSGDLSGI
jgi:ceramide glucosyltransferase